MPVVQAGEVILDMSVYPRASVSGVHVGTLVDALRSGAKFPAIVVEKGTMRVVDGFHRTHASIRFGGQEHPIEIEEREYPSEGALFLECAALNASHGLPITAFDRAKIAQKAEEMGLSLATVSAALQLPEDRLSALLTRRRAVGTDGQAVIVKKPAQYLAGSVLSAKQEEAATRAAGYSVTFSANQILNLLRGDCVDRTNRAVQEKLAELYRVLGEFLHQGTGEGG